MRLGTMTTKVDDTRTPEEWFFYSHRHVQILLTSSLVASIQTLLKET